MLRPLLLALLLASPALADWRQDLTSLVATESSTTRVAATARVLDAAPPWAEVAALLAAPPAVPQVEPGLHTLQVPCKDGVTRPYALVVPETFDPGRDAPLFVVLHGGVGRAELIEDIGPYAERHPFTEIAAARGWLAVFPQGQQGATWWDEVGMPMIRDIVLATKRTWPVDDDRVYLGGFSDGASAAFCHAMLDPSPYAAFVALNGHLGVASLDGDLPTYAPNLAATPIYATTTFGDQLYPSARMRPLLDMAREAGARITLRELEGDHSFGFVPPEVPRIDAFLDRHPRDPFPTRIVWETARRPFGRCHWLAIDRIHTGEKAGWHEDFNLAMTDDRIVIGFRIDQEYEGLGVAVASVPEGDSLANRIGLRAGDVILGGGDMEIRDTSDLAHYKGKLERGGPASLRVRRDGEEIHLAGTLPDPAHYLVFKREQPSGLARASFAANRVTVETSRVARLRILVHPDMVNLAEPLIIEVNGEVLFEERVEPDLRTLLEGFLGRRDRKLLYVAEVSVDVPR